MYRLQFEASEQTKETLDDLVKKLQSVSRAEVLRRAIFLMRRFAEVSAEDGCVMVQRKDGTVERWFI